MYSFRLLQVERDKERILLVNNFSLEVKAEVLIYDKSLHNRNLDR